MNKLNKELNKLRNNMKVNKDGQAQHSKGYITIDEINKELNKNLKDSDLAIDITMITEAYHDKVFVMGKAIVSLGDEVRDYRTLPLEYSKISGIVPKGNAAFNIGAATTYLKRYLLGAILHLSDCGEDSFDPENIKNSSNKTSSNVVEKAISPLNTKTNDLDSSLELTSKPSKAIDLKNEIANQNAEEQNLDWEL